MLITGREATRRLETCGISSRQARGVLDTGLAGRPIKTSASLLYDANRVDELVARPVLGAADIDRLCPTGVFVARRHVAVDEAREDQIAALAGGWATSLWVAVWLGQRIRVDGPYPFLATVGSLVAFGAQVEQVWFGAGCAAFRLGPPGPWFDHVAACRVRTGPGRPWVLHGGPWGSASVGGSRP